MIIVQVVAAATSEVCLLVPKHVADATLCETSVNLLSTRLLDPDQDVHFVGPDLGPNYQQTALV